MAKRKAKAKAKRRVQLRETINSPWFRKAWQEYAMNKGLPTAQLYAVGDGPPVPEDQYEAVIEWIEHRLTEVTPP